MHSQRRDRWLWASYDFANSMALVNLSLYFGIWFIAERHASDMWISVSVAVSTVAMLFALPVLGKMSDASGKRMPFLIICSLLCIASLVGLGVFTNGLETLSLSSTVVIFILYTAFNFFYNSCFAFYDAFVKDLTHDTHSLERTSGFGQGMGQIGNVTALLIALPLLKSNVEILGYTGKPLVFIVSGFLFFLFSIPVFLFLKDKPRSTHSVKLGRSIRETLQDLRKIRQYPGVLQYLITYCLFADALLTLQLFASSYLDTVGHMPDTQKNITFILAMIGGIVGSFISPVFVRLFGGRKGAQLASIALWGIATCSLAFATNPILFTILIALNGFGFGVLFPLSRAFFAALVPDDKQSEMFGIYALFSRTASVFGPMIWSGTALLFASFGDDRYRFSVLALGILVLISLFTMQRVKEPLPT